MAESAPLVFAWPWKVWFPSDVRCNYQSAAERWLSSGEQTICAAGESSALHGSIPRIYDRERKITPRAAIKFQSSEEIYEIFLSSKSELRFEIKQLEWSFQSLHNPTFVEHNKRLLFPPPRSNEQNDAKYKTRDLRCWIVWETICLSHHFPICWNKRNKSHQT